MTSRFTRGEAMNLASNARVVRGQRRSRVGNVPLTLSAGFLLRAQGGKPSPTKKEGNHQRPASRAIIGAVR